MIGFRAVALGLIFAAGLLGQINTALAQARWVLIATRIIDPAKEQETIGLSGARGAFTAVRLDMTSGAINLRGVQIANSVATIDSGALALRAGASSGPLAQSSDARFFSQIVLLRGSPVAASVRPIVQVWGLQTPAQAAMVKGAAPPVVVSSRPAGKAASPTLGGRVEPGSAGSGGASQGAARKLEPPRPPEPATSGASPKPASPPAPKTVAAPPPPPPPAPAPPASQPSASRPSPAPGGPVVASAPAPTSTPPVPAVSPTAANICVTKNICTPVRVFFGTDRRRADTPQRVAYSGDRARQLQLGVAVVTVPKAIERKRGEINLPTWFERNVLRVPPEGDPAKHFTILRDGFTVYSSADAFLDAVAGHMRDTGEFKDHAIVFVHGYNTTFDHALYRTAQISYDLGEGSVPFGTAFLYSWPSGGGVRDYKYDSESARFTVDNLIAFLDLVVSKTNAKHVHLIAHSMGNDPLLNALDRLVIPDAAKGRINQVVLAAPDVDSLEFERLASRILPKAKGVTLFASANDKAMQASRQVHRSPRAGDVPSAGPVIVKDLDTIDVTSISTEVFSINHSAYADSKELINDVALLFRKGERPPHSRTPILVQLPRDKPAYWKYP